MEYMEGQMQNMIEAGIADQSAKDERYSIIEFLRSGGHRYETGNHAWDSETKVYAEHFANLIEQGDHFKMTGRN